MHNQETVLYREENGIALITLNRPQALNALTWEALHRGLNLTLEESAQLGADYFALVASTNDFRIGTKAFIEKTNPTYTGT